VLLVEYIVDVRVLPVCVIDRVGVVIVEVAVVWTTVVVVMLARIVEETVSVDRAVSVDSEKIT